VGRFGSHVQLCTEDSGRLKSVVNVWNGLLVIVNFSTFTSFKRTVKFVDFSPFLKCSAH